MSASELPPPPTAEAIEAFWRGPALAAPDQAHLLVVSASASTHDMLRQVLLPLGGTLHHATHTEQSHDLLQLQPVDVVLLALGPDNLAWLNQPLPPLPQRPTVLALSTRDNHEAVRSLLQQGAHDVLGIDDAAALLRARVQASLERQRLQREQSQTLSQLRQEREALAVQRERADNLLANILPPSVIKRLGNAEQQVADAHASVSVLFADLVNFTAWANTQTAQTTVRALNQIYTAFDRATQAAGVEKIKTIGDAYMAVAGLAPPLPDHATRCAALGLQLQRLLHELVAQHQWPLNLRVGIHSGPVVAGVIGEHKFAYDVWGDTVNTASRIESAAQPGKVLVSASTALGCDDSLSLTPQTPLPLKGLGMVQTFEVQRKHPTQRPMG